MPKSTRKGIGRRRANTNDKVSSVESGSDNGTPEPSLPPPPPPLHPPPPPARQAVRQRQNLNFETYLASDTIDGPVPSDPMTPPRRPPKKVRKTAAGVPVGDAVETKLFSDAAFNDVMGTINKYGTVEQFLRTITTTAAKGKGSLRSLRKVLLDSDCVVWEKDFTKAVMDKVGWAFMKILMRRELKQFGESFIGKFDVVKDMDSICGKATSEEAHVVNETILDRLARFGDAEGMRAQAPILTDLIGSLVEPDRPQADRDAQWVPIAFSLAHLAKLYKPKKFIGIAEVLTLQMHHCNLTRRGIETLQAIGVGMSYTTLNDRLHRISEHHKQHVMKDGQHPCLIVAYDNFNASFNVRQALFGDEKQVCNVTTGLMKIGKHIPLGGLDRALFHPGFDLRTTDAIPFGGERMHEFFQLHNSVSLLRRRRIATILTGLALEALHYQVDRYDLPLNVHAGKDQVIPFQQG